jgi:hypothetical protein
MSAIPDSSAAFWYAKLFLYRNHAILPSDIIYLLAFSHLVNFRYYLGPFSVLYSGLLCHYYIASKTREAFIIN